MSECLVTVMDVGGLRPVSAAWFLVPLFLVSRVVAVASPCWCPVSNSSISSLLTSSLYSHDDWSCVTGKYL